MGWSRGQEEFWGSKKRRVEPLVADEVLLVCAQVLSVGSQTAPQAD